jgi:hypothetical protein
MVKLSLSKLEDFIKSLGYIPKRYFTVHESLSYIEVVGVRNSITFLMYIPSKYTIKMRTDENVFSMTYIDVSDDGNRVGDYADEPSGMKMEDAYASIDTGVENDIVDVLEKTYKNSMKLDNDNINKDLTDIFRQLRRYRYCVKEIPYKLCIIYKSYMCCIRRDNTFEGFKIDNYNIGSSRQLVWYIDLDSIYDVASTISDDLTKIQDIFDQILNRNQTIQTEILKKMMVIRSDVSVISESLMYKKNVLKEHLDLLKEMLKRMDDEEHKTIEQILSIKETYDMSKTKTLHTDMEHTRFITVLEEKINNVNSIKHEIIRLKLEIQSKYDNINLSIDKIMFDNSVMFDTIFKNFEKLKKINDVN